MLPSVWSSLLNVKMDDDGIPVYRVFVSNENVERLEMAW